MNKFKPDLFKKIPPTEKTPTEDDEFLGFKINELGERVAEFRDKGNNKTFVLDKETCEIRKKNLEENKMPLNSTSDALLSWPKEELNK